MAARDVSNSLTSITRDVVPGAGYSGLVKSILLIL